MADVRFERVRKTSARCRPSTTSSSRSPTASSSSSSGPPAAARRRCFAAWPGLEKVDAGRVWIGGRDATNLPPRRRRIAMVFQSYAVFPHMKVYDNVAFGLKMQRESKASIAERVHSAASLLHRGLARPLPVPALGRPAPARRRCACDRDEG